MNKNSDQNEIEIDDGKLNDNGDFNMVRIYTTNDKNKNKYKQPVKFLQWIFLSYKSHVFSINAVDLRYVRSFLKLFINRKLPLHYSNRFFTIVEKKESKMWFIQFDYLIKTNGKIDKELIAKNKEHSKIFLDILDAHVISEILFEATHGFSSIFLKSPKSLAEIEPDVLKRLDLQEQISLQIEGDLN